METPTSPVTAIDRQGKEHSFLMTFGARRRIMRRLRALQLRGELDPDLGKVEAIDSLELGYITLWESRQNQPRLSEDDYLSQFTDMTVATATNALWTRHRAESDPPSPEPEAVSQPNGKTTSNADASGAGGSPSDSAAIFSGSLPSATS